MKYNETIVKKLCENFDIVKVYEEYEKQNTYIIKGLHSHFDGKEWVEKVKTFLITDYETLLQEVSEHIYTKIEKNEVLPLYRLLHRLGLCI